MRVLMLGWEFPPYISGGLGAACFGLTRALNGRGIDITFVLPRPVTAGHSEHLDVIGPHGGADHETTPTNGSPAPRSVVGHTTRVALPSPITSPYPGGSAGLASAGASTAGQSVIGFLDGGPGHDANYAMADGPDAATQAYAAMCLGRLRGQGFDLIHAHDWPAFPAAIALSAVMRIPWVAHIHSTEFDRSGERPDPRIYDIERRGMHAATRVICVSHLTRKICEHRYGLDHAKAHVVYNGIDTAGAAIPEPGVGITKRDKIVLFLGRLTFQKGPEYFVNAAKKVLQKVNNVKFIIAGHGDMTEKTVELAASMGIGHRVLFSGFLRGKDVDRMFQMADVYVMPSISEPFGIAPLEAIRHDVPVIISRNSGVAEVLKHALKVDFWDIDEMANKIIAVLSHPPLSRTLREHADFEVRQLTWEGAADKCVDVYDESIKDMTEPAEPVRTIEPESDFSI